MNRCYKPAQWAANAPATAQLPILASRFPAMARFLDAAPTANQELPMDLYQDEGNYYAKLEAPGLKKSDLLLELDGRNLTISHESPSEDHPEGTFGTSRTLALPEDTDREAITAKAKDGIVLLTIPKKDNSRQIDIR